MNTKELILRYLRYPWKGEDGHNCKSPYMAALIDARKVTARNIRSGKKLNKEHGCWLGALGYMALVDHIGGVLKFKGEKLAENNFISALKFFSDLNEKERVVLYALRCSFAHNYHLYNKNEKKTEKMHHFSVTSGSIINNLIVFPKEPWDGSHVKKNDSNKTIVNLELFGDLVEEMHEKISNYAKEDRLEIRDVNLIKTFISY